MSDEDNPHDVLLAAHQILQEQDCAKVSTTSLSKTIQERAEKLKVDRDRESGNYFGSVWKVLYLNKADMCALYADMGWK